MRYQALAITFFAAVSVACTSNDGAQRGNEVGHQAPLGQDAGAAVPDAEGTILCTDPINCEGSETVDGTPVPGEDPEDHGGPLPPPDEVPCDGLDQDGHGADLCDSDADGDGFGTSNDCDDADPDVHWGADEQWCDGVDQNCNGFDECDQDEDGVIDTEDCAPDEPHAPCQDEPENEPSN